MHGHHLHPDGPQFCLSGGGDGLADPGSVVLETVQYNGHRVLRGRLSGGCQGGGRAPEIFNTDQGAQFTAHAFTKPLLAANIQISMDGRGRALDNIFIERFWRTIKYEDIYLKDYETVPALEIGLTDYFQFYNHQRLHQSLGYRSPADVYQQHSSCM